MKLRAYAKINIYLKVVNKIDNYHLLKMINAKVNLFDEIDITESKRNELIFLNSTLDPNKDDLILKILNYFNEEYGMDKHYQVTINKKIPIMAGLGGGSSDCAELIKFINEDNNLGLSIVKLQEIGKLFGADIPYCLHNEACLVEGIGEIITPIKLPNDLKDKDILIINPNILLPTSEIFKKYDELKKEYKSSDITFFIENDLEEAAFIYNKEMVKVKQYLLKYSFSKLMMSGSGSTYLGVANKDESKLIAKKIEQEKKWFVTINQILEV